MPLLNPYTEQYSDINLAKFNTDQLVKTIIIRDNSHLCYFAVMLNEVPPAYKWRELGNRAMIMLLAEMRDTSVINKGLSFFWGSGACIQLASASISNSFCQNQKSLLSNAERE